MTSARGYVEHDAVGPVPSTAQNGLGLVGLSLRLPSSWSESELFLDDPVVIFSVPEPLDPGAYEALLRACPGDDGVYDVHHTGSKKYLDNQNPAFEAFLSTSPPWRAMYVELASDENVSRLYRLTRPYLDHRPTRERLPWVLRSAPVRGAGRASTWRRRFRRFGAWSRGRTAVFIGFEFSTLMAGDRIPPHTDVPEKLLSLMIYFPRTAEQEMRPLGTEFYRARPGFESDRAWASGMPDDGGTEEFFRRHECYYQVPFHGNTLVGFVKSDRSWHGLREVDLRVGEERRALIFNVFRL